MAGLSWRKWVVVLGVGLLAGVLGALTVAQIAHWRRDEQQLHEIVTLIQQGRIPLGPPPTVPPAPKE